MDRRKLSNTYHSCYKKIRGRNNSPSDFFILKAGVIYVVAGVKYFATIFSAVLVASA